MPFIYLASPYSHPDPDIRLTRYRQTMSVVAEKLNQRVWLYSPIVHCHELSLYHKLPYDFNFWRGYNEAMIESAAAVAVLKLSGWEDSVGVKGEVRFANAIDKAVEYWEPPQLKLTDYLWSDRDDL